MSLLTGKIMFREVEYVTEDYSIRVVDGLLRFRYWLPYVQKELNEGELLISHSSNIILNRLRKSVCHTLAFILPISFANYHCSYCYLLCVCPCVCRHVSL